MTTSSESLSPEITDGWRETLAIAPENYSAGHFTLVTDDWSGKSTAGRMLATGISLGIDSGQLGNDPSGFDPGESWSFRFETSGQLMGLHFDDFTVDDADKALLFIGDAEPIAINAADVKGGYWRPGRMVEFKAGETLRLVALAPTIDDIDAAQKARREVEPDAAIVGPLPPWQTRSVWKVRGVNVIGKTADTLGGYIDFARREEGGETVSSAVLLEGSMAPPGMWPAGEDGASDSTESMAMSMMMTGNADITSFGTDPDNENRLEVAYSVTGGEVSNFHINVYRSLNGIHTYGAAVGTSMLLSGDSGGVIDIVVTPGSDPALEPLDYYLIAKIEGANDSYTPDNTEVFAGGVFVDGSTGIVHYHAAKSLAADYIKIQDSANGLQILRNGVLIYDPAVDFSQVHVRTHDGNDTIQVVDPNLDVELWAFAGYGYNNIYSGAGDDYLEGGDALDMIYGRGGHDTIRAGFGLNEDGYGGYGGYGGDFLFGGQGDDHLYGEEGPDWIDGGEGLFNWPKRLLEFFEDKMPTR